MDIKTIVKEYLERNGYDGIYYPGECACIKDDLFPCDAPHGDCVCGCKCPCDCGEHDFHIDSSITPTSPTPDIERLVDEIERAVRLRALATDNWEYEARDNEVSKAKQALLSAVKGVE